MDLQLAHKRAVITGSTKGIGFAIAQGLAREGADVTLNGRTPQSVAVAVERLRAEFPEAVVSGRAADFAHASEVEELLDSIDSMGEVDILVNNVGLYEVAELGELADERWQRYFDVNVMSGVRMSRHLLPAMTRRGWGRIVFVSSESGVDVPADMIHYGTTKAAMMALGNGLAKLTRGTAVTVNTVLGGPTLSDGVADTIAQIAQSQDLDPRDLATAIVGGNQTSLLQRFIDPVEIAHLVAYLASPLASATNGAVVRADGGVLTTLL